MKSRLILLFVYLFFQSGWADIVVPPVILLNINNGNTSSSYYTVAQTDSRLRKTSSIEAIVADTDVVSQDYKIYGSIYTNCENSICPDASNIYFEVDQSLIIMEKLTDDIEVSFTGTVGGQSINPATANEVIFTKTENVPNLPWEAVINLTGDVDESTVGATDRAGIYTGVLTIRVSMY